MRDQMQGLSPKSRQKIILRLAAASPMLAQALISEARRKQANKRRLLLNLVQRAKTCGVRVKTENGLHATVFRLDTRKAQRIIKTMNDAYTEHPQLGTTIYRSGPLSGEKENHYAASIPLGEERVYIVFRYNDAVTRVIDLLKHNLNWATSFSAWLVWRDRFVKTDSPVGKLLCEAVLTGKPPTICALLT